MTERTEIQGAVVCLNSDCALRGSGQVFENLQKLLNEADSNIKVYPYLCFELCDHGPNILLYPEGTIYCLDREKTPNPDEDLEKVAKHILEGEKDNKLSRKSEEFKEAVARAIDIINSGLIPGLPLKKSA